MERKVEKKLEFRQLCFLKTGHLDLSNFYSRRFIRLFPASCFVLLTTAVSFKLFELPEYVKQHKMSFIASALCFENWYGLHIALDYFTDEGTDQSPVVHFWSLSVEGMHLFNFGLPTFSYFFRLLLTFSHQPCI